MGPNSPYCFEIETRCKWNTYVLLIKSSRLKASYDFECPPCVFNDEKERHLLRMQEVSIFLCRYIFATVAWAHVFTGNTMRCLAPDRNAVATMHWVKTTQWPRGELMLCGCQNCMQVRNLVWHNTRNLLFIANFTNIIPEKFIDYPFETIPLWTPSHNKPS